MNSYPGAEPDPSDQAAALCALYEVALPEVYGYLARRCNTPATAEDLTSETFLAAVGALKREPVPNMTTAWLVAVARHKLVDHWRRQFREDAKLALAADTGIIDDWEEELDALRAHEALSRLAPHHRVSLTLRYLDGLSVPEIATLLDRTVHATEALLVRARVAFRRAYGEDGPDA